MFKFYYYFFHLFFTIYLLLCFCLIQKLDPTDRRQHPFLPSLENRTVPTYLFTFTSNSMIYIYNDLSFIVMQSYSFYWLLDLGAHSERAPRQISSRGCPEVRGSALLPGERRRSRTGECRTAGVAAEPRHA